MFRRRLIAALVAATLATPLQAGEPASYVQLQVTAVEVVVRAAPRADAPRIGTLMRGALAEVLEVTDDWVQVDLGAGAGVGWLHRGSIDDETVALFTAAERLRSARDAAGSERDDSRARPGPGCIAAASTFACPRSTRRRSSRRSRCCRASPSPYPTAGALCRRSGSSFRSTTPTTRIR